MLNKKPSDRINPNKFYTVTSNLMGIKFKSEISEGINFLIYPQ